MTIYKDLINWFFFLMMKKKGFVLKMCQYGSIS